MTPPDGPDVVGARTVVLGAGTSGAAAARALLDAGATAVRVVDSRDTAPLRDTAVELRARGADVRLGVSDAAAVAGAQAVVTSPGLPLAHPLLAAALALDVAVLSEPELALRLNRGRTRLVAVTGTNGKTTTTELTAACLDAPAVGNIGPPACGALAVADPPPVAVAELSSFQLRFTDVLHAEVGVLLNVAPDHLDWHPDVADYEASKARVWANQRGTDAAVVFTDDDGAARVHRQHPPGGRTVAVSLGTPPAGGLGVEGGWLVSRLDDAPRRVVELAGLATEQPAYVADAACAAAAALAAGAAPDAVGAALRAARPGPHRLERVAVVDGVSYVNDSKATNPHAAAAALSAFDSVVWIAGGLNKGLDLDVVRGRLAERAHGVVAIGRAAGEVAGVARAAGVPVETAPTMAAAVATAARMAAPGDVVLLAPACASMDQYRDYAERGVAFRSAVAALPGAGEDGVVPDERDARRAADGR